MMNLKVDGNGTAVQSMPFVQGYIDLTTGTVTGRGVILCKVDGSVQLNFVDETNKTVTMSEGQDRSLPSTIVSVTVLTGTFDFA